MPVFTSAIEVTADYPTIKPSLNLNFVKARALDPRVTLERASVGTYVGRDGLIKTAGEDEPRFDHDPVTLESLGLLIEESRTNIAYGTPSAANATLSTSQDNSLTGTNNAFLVTKNSGTASQSHLNFGVNGSVSTTSFVASVFVKGVNTDTFFIQTTSTPTDDNLYIYFNTSTGVTSFTDFNNPSVTVTAFIEDYHDGWKRLVAVIQNFAQSSFNGNTVRIGFANPANNSQQYQNNTHQALVYGFQVEDGSFPTSYIPTESATGAVTRQDDFGFITGANFSSWFNQIEGTLDVGYRLGYDNVGMRVCQISNQNANTVIDLVVGSGGGQGGYWFINTGGVTQFSSSGVSNSGQTDRNFRAVLAYKENDCAAQSNKITSGPTTDTNVTLATDYNRLLFYQIANGGDQIQGHLKYIRYYPKRITNAQVTLLSQDDF